MWSVRPASRISAKRSRIRSGEAGAGLDRLVDVSQDPAQRSERGVGGLLAEHLDVPSMHAVGAPDQALHAPLGDLERPVSSSSIASSIVQPTRGPAPGASNRTSSPAWAFQAST